MVSKESPYIHTSDYQQNCLISSKTLKQDGTAKTPFDMSQYENLIGTTRIPRRGRDELIYGHQRKHRQHIFLTRNGHVSDFLLIN